MMIKENDVKKTQNFWLDAKKKFHVYSTSIQIYLQVLLLSFEIFIESNRPMFDLICDVLELISRHQ